MASVSEVTSSEIPHVPSLRLASHTNPDHCGNESAGRPQTPHIHKVTGLADPGRKKEETEKHWSNDQELMGSARSIPFSVSDLHQSYSTAFPIPPILSMSARIYPGKGLSLSQLIFALSEELKCVAYSPSYVKKSSIPWRTTC